MSKNLLAHCLVLASAAGLGYWIWSDSAPEPAARRPSSEAADPFTANETADSSELERFTSGEVVEIIDLTRVFEPTGDELNLQLLFQGLEQTELLPLPRIVAPETLPPPRIVGAGKFAEAGEEASSPPRKLEQLRRDLGLFVVQYVAEILSQIQPLKGTIMAAPDGKLPPELD